MHIHIYIYIYIYIHIIYSTYHITRGRLPGPRLAWSRTNGVNTNRAAAEVVNVDGLVKKVSPGTSGKIKVY